MAVCMAYFALTAALLILGSCGVVAGYSSGLVYGHEYVFTPASSHPEDQATKQNLVFNIETNNMFPENNTLVVAQVGGEVAMRCFTRHISDEMVTWMKRDNDQLLTVGQAVYATGNRFSAAPSRHTNAWELWIKDVQLSDSGDYECQLTIYPPVTFFFTLKVLQAEAVMSGPTEVHIEEGSKLDLECHVRGAVSPPVYIFWFHNSTMVNYGRHRTLQVKHRNYTSSLTVETVQLSDAGVYSCEPHLAISANVSVHVVKGNNPAAMQHGRNPVNAASSADRLDVPWSMYVLLILLSTNRKQKRVAE